MLLATVVGCAGPGTPAASVGPASAAPAAPGGPVPATVMVCADEGQQDIATLIGIRPLRVDPPTWTDHIYSCRYIYRDGAFALSVKELPDVQRTTEYFEQLAAQRGNTGPVRGLGDGAFVTGDGSVVARLDTKVLLVDITALPPSFGRPPVGPPAAARLVAKALMDCWTGG